MLQANQEKRAGHHSGRVRKRRQHKVSPELNRRIQLLQRIQKELTTKLTQSNNKHSALDSTVKSINNEDLYFS